MPPALLTEVNGYGGAPVVQVAPYPGGAKFLWLVRDLQGVDKPDPGEFVSLLNHLPPINRLRPLSHLPQEDHSVFRVSWRSYLLSLFVELARRST
jgi:hypothetical protein